MKDSKYVTGEELSRIHGVCIEDVESILREMGVGYRNKVTAQIIVENLDKGVFSESASIYKRSTLVFDMTRENPGITRNKLCEKLETTGAGGFSRSSMDIILRVLSEKYPQLYEEDSYGLFLSEGVS